MCIDGASPRILIASMYWSKMGLASASAFCEYFTACFAMGSSLSTSAWFKPLVMPPGSEVTGLIERPAVASTICCPIFLNITASVASAGLAPTDAEDVPLAYGRRPG